MNKLEITVTIKQVYGRDVIYPACEQAKLFAELVGQKTLTSRDIKIIKALNYTIIVKPVFSTL